MAVPDVLWHYTDAAGLQGILESGVLRLTDVRFLNDRSERTYGFTTARSIVADMVRAGEVDGDIIEQTYATLTAAGQRFYICSLSEHCDVLSQWQRYAADGYGYCIGFEAKELVTVGGLESNEVHLPELAHRSDILEPTLLRQMLYDSPAQLEKIRRCVSEVLRQTKGRELAPIYLFAALEQVALQFKNPLFADEHEWRLIQHGGYETRQFIHFSAKGHYVRPFVATHKQLDGKAILPVRGIVCGPRLEDDLAAEAVRELLTVNNYSVYDIDVRRSRLHGTWR